VNGSSDTSLSVSSQEFVWVDSSIPRSHNYLIPPTLKALLELGARTVLDLGCGNGSCSAALHCHGLEVVGCDSSASGIALARRTHPGIDFFEHEISCPLPLDYAGPYDAVVSLEVVQHLMQPRQLTTTAFGALRPGGLLIISTPFHGYWKNPLANRLDSHCHPLRDFGHVKFFPAEHFHSS
jgi:2-polyprenyl-3-methyl-5-hydroxy-6-metoxy-1,4-benzoquinol methylase